MTPSPDPIVPQPQTEDDEPIVYGDDAVIGRALRISLVGFFGLGALTAVVWLLWPTPAPAKSVDDTKVTGPALHSPAADPNPPTLQFTDVTQSAGIDFVRTDGADGRKLLPETMGGGVAVADFDGDGSLDLAFADGHAWPDAPAGTAAGQGVVLYLNDGAMHFRRLHDPELAIPAQYMGLASADVDGDGRTDLLVTGVEGVRLLRNVAGAEGAPTFQDVTQSAGLGVDDGWSTSAGFADLDGDGDLDLVVLHYVKWSPEIDAKVDYRLAGVGRAYGPPTGFPGAQLRLYEQTAPWQFTDRTQERGLVVNTSDLSKQGAAAEPAGKGLGLAIDDVNGDGALDLLVANDKARKFLFVNDGHGTFTERGVESGFAFDRVGAATGAMGIDVARLRATGAPYVIVGNFANEPSGLYSTPEGSLRFSDDSIVEGISAATRPFLTFGVLFADFDLDGRPDLVQANGHIEDQIARAQAHQSYRQRIQLFLNSGQTSGPCLMEVAPEATGALATPLIGRGAAWGDLDGDGDLDLVVAQSVGAPAVLRNDRGADAGSWVGIQLQQPGSHNRDAIGAVVRVGGPSGPQTQLVMPVRSYLSSVPAQAWFGIAPGTHPVEVTVTWPDGTSQKHSVLRGKRSTLVKGS
jgi:hypothetical protein